MYFDWKLDGIVKLGRDPLDNWKTTDGCAHTNSDAHHAWQIRWKNPRDNYKYDNSVVFQHSFTNTIILNRDKSWLRGINTKMLGITGSRDQ